MKPSLFLTILAILAFGSVATAADEPTNPAETDDHSAELAETKAGPNLGRILSELSPPAELFVTKERKVQITFLIEDESDGVGGEQATVLGDPSISAYCGNRAAATRMSFEMKEGVFLSDKPLPAGTNIPTVIQIKMSPDAETTTIRLNLNLAGCPTCEHPEYACTCAHGAGEEHDEGHDEHDGHAHE